MPIYIASLHLFSASIIAGGECLWKGHRAVIQSVDPIKQQVTLIQEESKEDDWDIDDSHYFEED